jgi:hypothetical protein
MIQIIVCLCILPLFSFAQKLSKADRKKAEIEAYKPIQQLFDGMRKGDSSMVRTAFHPSAKMQTIYEKNGTPKIGEESYLKFAEAVGTPHPEIWDERITNYEVKIDGRMAAIWTEYSFYLGDKFSHCGVNSFQLFKDETGWKIIYIVDTRRKEGCK